MISAFDRINQEHRARRKPMVALEAFEVGQDCPMPRCTGRLEHKPLGRCECHVSAPCYGCENAFLGCDAPGCGWTEKAVQS